MTKEDFKKIALAIKTTYPTSKILETQDAMNIWYTLLQDLDYRVCQNAVLELISTCKFCPTIAEIREKCSGITSLPIKDYGEAWETVMRAVSRFGMYNQAEALESLDELTRKCTKRLGFGNICMSENITADRANFRMIYEQEANRKKTDNQLPQLVRSEKLEMIEVLVNSTVKQIGEN